MQPRANPKALDLSTPCPLCGYRIPPAELVWVAMGETKCSKCGGVLGPAVNG